MWPDVLFLSFVVAVAGGIMRDVLIGAVPPAAITEIHYVSIAIFGGLLLFRTDAHRCIGVRVPVCSATLQHRL
ncbi:MAG TPA: TRIC cation channel family protein [Kofleriaceae bacterium]|nr:TRIC cation channel family protein [Kofleriaceae bacterium]